MVNTGECLIMSKKVPHRLSISLSEAHYEALRRLADTNRVSVSWVVREAVRRYVEEESPLFNELHQDSHKENQKHV